jgi:hypothetical protein
MTQLLYLGLLFLWMAGIEIPVQEPTINPLWEQGQRYSFLFLVSYSEALSSVSLPHSPPSPVTSSLCSKFMNTFIDGPTPPSQLLILFLLSAPPLSLLT